MASALMASMLCAAPAVKKFSLEQLVDYAVYAYLNGWKAANRYERRVRAKKKRSHRG